VKVSSVLDAVISRLAVGSSWSVVVLKDVVASSPSFPLDSDPVSAAVIGGGGAVDVFTIVVESS
jgi:hypothetical protein